jgi:hypothetical protein
MNGDFANEQAALLAARLRRESGLSESSALDQYCLLTLNANAFFYLD